MQPSLVAADGLASGFILFNRIRNWLIAQSLGEKYLYNTSSRTKIEAKMESAKLILLRMSPSLALLIVFFSFLLPYSINSQWMWLDDQLIFDRQLYPLYSQGQISNRLQGRDFTWHGVYYEAIAFLFGLRPQSYYVTTLSLHFVVTALATLLVAQSTRSGVAALCCAITVGLVAAGPETFLTLTKSELRLSFFFVLLMLCFSKLINETRWNFRAAYLFVFGYLVFLSGILGKETFFIFPLALLTIVIFKIIFVNFRLNKVIDQNLIFAFLSSFVGIFGVLAQRAYFGVAGPQQGSYTAQLFDNLLVFNLFLERLTHYGNHLAVAFLLLAIVTFLVVLRLPKIIDRNSNSGKSDILICLSGICGVGYIVFIIIFIEYVTTYYFYPGLIMIGISICLTYNRGPAPSSSKVAGLGVGALATRLVVLATAVVTLAGLPMFLLRVHVQTTVRAAEWKLFQSVAQLPTNSIVLLPFTPGAEMIGNLALIMSHSFNRTDIQFKSGLVRSELAPIIEQAPPTYSVMLYDLDQNWMIGLRGISYGTRQRQRGILEATGVTLDCRVDELVRPAERWTVLRLMTISVVEFSYNWEIHQVAGERSAALPCR